MSWKIGHDVTSQDNFIRDNFDHKIFNETSGFGVVWVDEKNNGDVTLITIIIALTNSHLNKIFEIKVEVWMVKVVNRRK